MGARFDAATVPPSAPASDRILTIPNLFTLLRLACLPLFLYLLLGRDNPAAAAWLLGGLGATDWVDGYLARRLGQVSEFGKVFDPTVDRAALHRRPVRHHHRRCRAAVVLLGHRHPRGACRDDDGRGHVGVQDAAHRRQLVGQAGHVPVDVRRARIHARVQRLSRGTPDFRSPHGSSGSPVLYCHGPPPSPTCHGSAPPSLSAGTTSEHVAVRYVGAP